MNDCIFCQIVENKTPSRTLYEDDLIKVIMNINPNTDGHLLVIPKKHYETLFDVDKSLIDHSIDVIKKTLYPKLVESLDAKGLTIAQNNFCGQEIKHFHLHLVPRYPGDGIDLTSQEKLSNLDEIANKLGIN